MGALSVHGHEHVADIVILASGANTGVLIDVKDKIAAQAMCVATIQLTPQEVVKYKDLPMVDHFEQGKYQCQRFACRERKAAHLSTFLEQFH